MLSNFGTYSRLPFTKLIKNLNQLQDLQNPNLKILNFSIFGAILDLSFTVTQFPLEPQSEENENEFMMKVLMIYIFGGPRFI